MLAPVFVVDRFVEQCRAAIAAEDAERAVQELVAEAVADAGAVSAALGEPGRSGPVVLYRAPDLTVLDFAWAPWMCFKPHNHSMWSVVGIITGREDNLFW